MAPEQGAATEERYAVIELVRGPNWTAGVSAGLIGVQLRHLRTLWRLRRRGLVLIAGPVTGMEPVRGVIVVRRGDVDATLAALQDDDAIRRGRLVARVVGSASGPSA